MTDTNKEILHAKILFGLCTGLIYSMLFWTYLNSIIAILLAVFWLFFLKKEFKLTSERTKLMLLFISLYAIGLAGFIYTSNINHGVAILQKQSALLFFPLIFGSTSLLNSSLLKKLVPHYLVATGLACIIGVSIGLYNFLITGNIAAVTGKGLLVFHAFNPIIMGLYCLLALCFIITFENLAVYKFRKWLVVLTIILSGFIFLLSIRIILFCWFLLALFFLWKIIKRNVYRIILAISLIFFIALVSFLIPTQRTKWKELADFSKENTIILDKDSSLKRSWGGKALRMAIWQCSFDVLKKHWLLGVGTGDTQDSLQQAYENRKFYFASRYNKYNAHNQYLQFGIGFGIPGVLLFVLIILYPLYLFSRKNPKAIYILFLLIFAITAFTESVFEVNKGIMWYSFFNSIFAFTSLKHQPDINL